MGGVYINYYFKNIEYDDGFYGGVFSSPDSDVYCEFLYDRTTKEFVDIWNNSKPIEEILPMCSCNNSQKNGSLHEAEIFFSEHVASQLDSILVLEKMGG